MGKGLYGELASNPQKREMSSKKRREIKSKSRTRTVKKSKIEIPKKYVSLALVLFCVFIIGGGIYNILEEPPLAIGIGGLPSSLHPYINEQTAIEAWIMMLIDGAIVIGFYMTYRSTQVSYNRTAANRWLMGGIALIILGFGGNFLMLQLKQSLL